MGWAEFVILVSRPLIPLAQKLWAVTQRRHLAVRLEPMDDSEMLRAFSASLTNKSSESVRLDSIFIRKPNGSQIAVRFHYPMMALGEPRQPEPWQRVQRYTLNRALDPGETYDCEIGIPKGFAISASRKTPVTIAVEMTTFGERERRVVQDVKRSIIVD